MKDEKHAVFVAPDHKIVLRSFYRDQIWRPARALNEDLSSSTAWFSALELIYDYEDVLYFSDGQKYPLPDLGEEFVDLSNRWMRNFLEANEEGTGPKHYSNKIERLRIIELFCRLIRQEGELS